MSAFVAIVDLHERAVDRLLLQELTDFLFARGPDARATHAAGPAGLGFALFATAEDVTDHEQPRTVDGRCWIVGDVRLDGRDDLVRKFGARGVESGADPSGACDAALVLRAYAVWGESCVEHLLGDFAFVIWDAPARTLFAARDRFGVKPFYHAEIAGCVLASNSLNCLRRHPDVSDRLNDQAVGDFLVFGYNQDGATTTFADIRRLPPAHTLTCRDGRVETRRYWQLPADSEVRFRRDEEYVECFRDLLRTAVADRLRTRRAGVLMSGGLDSTAIAAQARQLRGRDGTPAELRAYTLVYDKLIPDQERYYATVAADSLGMPIHFLAGDDYAPFTRGDCPPMPAPEPPDEAVPALLADQLAQAAARGRVLLTGFGGDPLFASSPLYMMNLLTGFRWLRWLSETARYAWSRRRLPPLGLRSRMKRWLGFRPWQPPYPAWLDADFAARLGLRRRFEAALAPAEPTHPRHAEAHQQLAAPYWPALFECLDPCATGRAVDVRHPFFDVRLVNFVLGIPPLPWCADKEILRSSLRGLLPEEIRTRPKAPLAGDPLAARFRRSNACWADYATAGPELVRYVNVESVRRLAESHADAEHYAANLVTRPLCLGEWLAAAVDRSPFRPEETHEAPDAARAQESLSRPEAHGLRRRP
jgi:asparagine synthase (glutamine-hydrolysing)